ncbi:MAG: serine/threonine-protein kinase, partial [Polyangiaceae bacterium]
PAARVAHLLAQIAGALTEAHGVGLLHRDVKPANVFLCERGGAHDVVKVLDFGLSKELGESGIDLDRSEAGSIVGTPTYLAPEAITAPEKMDGRSDLYALGALGYFLLTGVPPFQGNTVLEMCAQHVHAAPEPLSSRVRFAIPAELERLVMSCLAKSPADRPRDAATLRSALLPLADSWTEERALRCWDARATGATVEIPIAQRFCVAETLPGEAMNEAA